MTKCSPQARQKVDTAAEGSVCCAEQKGQATSTNLLSFGFLNGFVELD